MKPNLISRLLASAALLCASATASALPAGYFANSTPLSSGRWVKITVSETGMQEITAEELAAMGFSDPSKVAVCGYGGAMLGNQQFSEEIPDAVAPVPSMVTGGKLIFYGEAGARFRPWREPMTAGRGRWKPVVTRNYYSDEGAYFLTETAAPAEPARIARADASGTTSLENTTWGFTFRALEKSRFGTLGARFFGDDLKETGPQSFDNHLPGYKHTTAVSQDYNRGIHFAAAMAVKALTQQSVKWQLPSRYTFETKSRTADQNLQNYRELQIFGMENAKEADGDIYTVKVWVGDNSNSVSPSLQYGAVDYYSITYLRSTDFSEPVAQQTVTFTSLTDPAQQLRLDGASPSLTVWDVTEPLAPRHLLRGPASDEADAPDAVTLGRTGVAPDGTAPTFLVFDPAMTLHKVTFAGEVATQNLHSMSAPEMLIVAAREFMPQAERLAEIHRSLRGTDAVAVCQEEIFNEFASGTRTHEAIRRFARMLRDRGPEKFRSILLMGYASSDNRGITIREEGWRDRYVPVYECPHLSIGGHHSLSYASDIFYGILSDDFSIYNAIWPKMDIAVGRLPAQNSEQANDMVDKIEKYLKNPPSTGSTNRALLMADSDNDNNFVTQAEALAAIVGEEKPSTMLYKAYDDLYPHDNDGATHYHNFVASTLQEGACFMAYFGHGSSSAFGANNLWNSTLAKETFYPVPPLTVLGTCSPLSIDLSPDCIGAWMFINKNGGSIGVIGAQREVYMNYNFDIVEAVTRKYFSAEPNATLGEIFRQAVNSNTDLQEERNRIKQEEFDKGNPGSTTILAIDSALILNTRSYTFVGDPEIPSYSPTHSARLTAVNSIPAADAAIEVEPLKPLSIEGAVVGSDGEVDASFNGEAIIMVYDSPRNVKDVSNRPIPLDIATNQYPILNVKAEVKAGRFSTTATLPLPARPGGTNTVSLYAMSDNGFEHANGSFDNLRVLDTDPNALPEPEPPLISSLYIDSPEFVSGQVTGPDFTLNATITDPSGVIGVSSLFGKSLTVTLDDSKNLPGAAAWLSTDTDGTATLALPVSGLVDGHHRLTLTARGNAGGESSRSVDFTVVSTPAKALLSTDRATALTETEISLEHDFADTPGCRLVVTDSQGRAVMHAPDATFPYRWNLADARGNRVPDGLYTATAYLHSGLRYATASVPIVVLTKE